MKFPALLMLFALMPLTARTELKPVDLHCEYMVNPIGIDSQVPRLSWRIESTERGQQQTAYQIVATSDRRSLWDSGKIDSSESLHIHYGGPKLRSGQRCEWKVRVWDKGGRQSSYSASAFWEMGLLAPEDWHGQWIGATKDKEYHPSPLLRKTFAVDRSGIKRARAYICGLGYYELHLNGQKVGDHVLDPGYTRYDRRALYATYDVTANLKQGQNAIGVMLGTGWYNEHTKAVWYFDRAPWRAAPKLLFELRIDYDNGKSDTIVSDDQWRVSDGPIRFDSIYGGETYDALQEKPGWDTAGYQDGAWHHAMVVDSPGGKLVAQQMPPIRVDRIIRPAKITEPKPGMFIFDMGQNFTGWAELAVSGAAGKQVNLRYGERLNQDGTLDTREIAMHQVKTDPPQPFQTDHYFLKGKGLERWHARFCYHGYQYVEVTGFPGTPTTDSLRGLFIHSDIVPVGEFACSNPMLNKIWEAGRWSYLSNLESIPTDCPHREKNGWTGDAHLACEQGLFNFAGAPVYTKWINDLGDEQRPTGDLPGIVPTSGWGYDWGNGPAWDSAYLLIPWYVYVYCGDADILKSHYEGMKRYVDYLTSKSKDGINALGLNDWAPWKTETPADVTSTGYYYRDTQIVAKTAELLGKTEDAGKYKELSNQIWEAFNRQFYHADLGSYGSGSQTALSCALYQGFVPEDRKSAVLRALVADIERKDNHIDTGILGAKYLLNSLTDNGAADVAYRVASQKTQPSWGWWIEQGATTLWEQWNGADSRNHIMYGDICAWFYKTLAGINPDPEAPGFKHFTIKPHVVGDLTWTRAKYESIRGTIESDWRVESGSIELNVTVPANTTATIFVPSAPGADVSEGRSPADKAISVRFVRREPGYTVYEVGSGHYEFASRMP